MNFAKTLSLAALALGCVVTMSHAGANVTVTSNAPRARVFLDGQFMGQAPLQMAQIHAGQHIIKVQKQHSREEQVFQILSPRGRSIPQNINVLWQHRGPRPVVVQQVVQQQPVYVQPQPVVVQQAAVVQQPVVVQQQPVVVQQRVVDPVAQQQVAKTNTRTALLGAAVANELLNKGNSKGLIRGVALGGALLNEVAR